MKSNVSMKTGIALAACSTILILAPVAFGAQAESAKPWSVLEKGLGEKKVAKRLAVVRVLGLIHEDPHAADLAENALKDSNASVRAAAATALGEMHATTADAALKEALNDRRLPVVMAAAHALHLLNNPACYDVYYDILTGERKGDSSMVSQEMEVLRDPRQVAAMGFSEGIGFLPFAGVGWEAVQTVMKDKKSGAASKALLILALATDPDARVDSLLVRETRSSQRVLRVAALQAIAKRGKPALAADIAKALNDSKSDVKYTAAATIIHLDDVRETHDQSAQSTLMTP
jgi:HEAT repeat protein